MTALLCDQSRIFIAVFWRCCQNGKEEGTGPRGNLTGPNESPVLHERYTYLWAFPVPHKDDHHEVLMHDHNLDKCKRVSNVLLDLVTARWTPAIVDQAPDCAMPKPQGGAGVLQSFHAHCTHAECKQGSAKRQAGDCRTTPPPACLATSL